MARVKASQQESFLSELDNTLSISQLEKRDELVYIWSCGMGDRPENCTSEACARSCGAGWDFNP